MSKVLAGAVVVATTAGAIIGVALKIASLKECPEKPPATPTMEALPKAFMVIPHWCVEDKKCVPCFELTKR